MTIPLLAAMLVAAVSAVLPPKNDKNSATSSSGSLGWSLTRIGGEWNQVFYSGIVLGMGFSWLLSWELQRSRLHDRIRLALQDLFRPLVVANRGCDREEAPAPGAAFSLLAKATQKQSTNGEGNTSGLVATLVSPSTALTSTLWVATICIPPQHELKLHKSNGLEFFHVLQGKGRWSDQEPKRDGRDINSENNIADGNILNPGDAFFIEANSLRWISNTSSTEDLVLVRSSDGGHKHRQQGYDEVVPSSETPSTITTVSGQLSAAMTSGYQQAGAYWDYVFASSG